MGSSTVAAVILEDPDSAGWAVDRGPSGSACSQGSQGVGRTAEASSVASQDPGPSPHFSHCRSIGREVERWKVGLCPVKARGCGVAWIGRARPGPRGHVVFERDISCAVSVSGQSAALRNRRCHHLAAFNRCKFKQRRATLCQHRGTPLLQQKALLQKNFRRLRVSVQLLSVVAVGTRVIPRPPHRSVRAP
jgi:hypothetical protein